MARMTIQHVLERLGGEAFIQRLIGQIEAVAQATDETGQAGKVTLVVKTSKEKHSEPGDQFVAFETKMTPTLPAPKPHRTGLYVGSDGLHTFPPNQVEMEGMRVVEQGQPEARTVSVGQPETRRA